MVKKTVDCPETEPKQRSLPSEGVEHKFQVVDIIEDDYGNATAKCEVVEGDETGRSSFNRVSFDENWSGFFLTRLFLKAIGEPYKGKGVNMDSDNWIGKEFYATVIHNEGKNGKVYANIDQYNFDKIVDQPKSTTADNQEGNPEKAWDE